MAKIEFLWMNMDKEKKKVHLSSIKSGSDGKESLPLPHDIKI